MTDEAAAPLEPLRASVSYSWDSRQHREWVAALGARLRFDCVDLMLDEWNVHPGDQLPRFMETAIRESDFVLIVCTPRYKEKSDSRAGGVGYEGNIITAELYSYGNERKFVPLLRAGEWGHSAPSWLLGKYYIDFRGDPYPEASYVELRATLLGVRPTAPGVRALGSQDHLSPEAATRQHAYTEFVSGALALFGACNKRFVLFRTRGSVAAFLSNEVATEIKQCEDRLQRLLQEINLLSSEAVRKAAYEVYGWAFAGQVASMAPQLEVDFRKAHSKLASEAIPKFREAIRDEARLR